MERRDFLKLASLAGLAVASGGAITSANAFDPKQKTLWLMIDAGGGWDPTSLVDPKGALQGEFPNKYPASAIKQRGGWVISASGGVEMLPWHIAGETETVDAVGDVRGEMSADVEEIWWE